MDEQKVMKEEVFDGGIAVDSGKINVIIRNELGEQTGVFRFNPTDVMMVKRYNEVVDKFESVMAPLVDNSDPEADPMKIMDEAGDKMIELMDYVLDGNSREAFFNHCHPFSPVNGKFYCEHVFEAVGNFISKKFDAEIKSMNSRVQQRAHGYRTGKHKKGDR